jgi:hypothetical protein
LFLDASGTSPVETAPGNIGISRGLETDSLARIYPTT